MHAKGKKSSVEDLFASVVRLLGRTPSDPELKDLLVALELWPVPPFPEDEVTVYPKNKAAGFCLQFDDRSTVDHAVAEGTPAGAPIFVCAFFYPEGVEGYHRFTGALPSGITWSDTAADLVRKLGPPQSEIKNKRNGSLSAHGWPVGQWYLTASYVGGGDSIDRLDVNIF